MTTTKSHRVSDSTDLPEPTKFSGSASAITRAEAYRRIAAYFSAQDTFDALHWSWTFAPAWRKPVLDALASSARARMRKALDEQIPLEDGEAITISQT